MTGYQSKRAAAQDKLEQEPAACKPLCELCVKRGYTFCANTAKTTPIPTPPKRTWVELTDKEIQPMVQKAMVYYGYKPEHSTLTSGAGFYVLARAVVAKLKEKNT